MTFYRMLKLREKIILLMMLVSFTVLGITNALYVSRMIPGLKQSMISEYSNYAVLIGNSVIGSLLFADTDTASEVLRPLAKQKNIVSAVIYDDQANFFAGYGNEYSHTNKIERTLSEATVSLSVNYTFLENSLVIVSPIYYDDAIIGHVRLHADVTDKNAEFYSQLIISFVTFLVSLLLAYALANKFQKVVTVPVSRIVELMHKVTIDNDFSVRAQLRTHDELSRLGEGFNAMLTTIESRDQELNEYKTSLEEKVEHRTEQLKLATLEANAATEAKSDFLAKMSHEIRTPLNAVIGFSKLTLRSDLDSKQREKLNKILDSSETLLGLINDILDFSKIEAGKLELEQVDFNLEKVVQRAMGVVGLRAYEKNLELVNYIGPDVPKYLTGDPLRLQQVIINLCTNAVKFTEQGSVSVMIDADCLNDAIKLKIEVTDTGIGISPDRQKNLFQSFSQADNSITRKYGGTGLGLTICKQLCELMGGEISVSSEEGKGSCFTFTAIFHEAELDIEELDYSSVLSQMNILIVDDNSLSRKVISDSLVRVARQIDTAVDGLDALNKVQIALDASHPYDLIIMDWNMPNMDGLEAAKIIKRDLEQDTPEILMVSAYDKDKVMPQASEFGLTHFLEKPFTASSLVDYLGEMLSGDKTGNMVVHSEVQAPNLAGHRVLLVEDNKLNQQVALGFLSETNLEIDIAENGQKALDVLRSGQNYDLIFMDVQMPVMDGLTATRKIREDLKLTLPIVAMTAHVMDEDSRKSKAVGMNEHLSKPIELQELYSVLTAYLTVSRPVSEGLDTNADTKNLKAEMIPVGDNLFYKEINAIDGINPQDALSLFNGNVIMLEDFVHEFIASNELIATLKTAITESDIDGVNRVSHTLKNQLAYIGASEACDMAKELELISSRDSVSLNVIMHSAQTLLEELERLIDLLLKNVTPKQHSDAVFNVDVCQQRLTLLRSKLERSDMESEDIAIEIDAFCKGTEFEDAAEKLLSAAASLDFKKASEFANELHTKLANV